MISSLREVSIVTFFKGDYENVCGFKYNLLKLVMINLLIKIIYCKPLVTGWIQGQDQGYPRCNLGHFMRNRAPTRSTLESSLHNMKFVQLFSITIYFHSHFNPEK